MFIKKFLVNSFEEGLKQIKAELGPDALIINTEKRKGGVFGRSSVEITAAVKEGAQDKSDGREKKAALAATDLARIFPHRENSAKEINPSKPKYIEISEHKSSDRISMISKNRFYEDFIRLGVTDSSAKELVFSSFGLNTDKNGQVQDPAQAKISILARKIQTLPFDEICKKKRIAMIGTPGSGKTMGIVKFALHLKNQKQAVSLSSLDERKIVSPLELHHYGRLLRVPVRKSQEIHDQEIQLVDTPSLRLDSEESNWDLVKRLREIPTSILLCLEASMRLTEMIRVVQVSQRFFNVDGIFITKLDLVTLSGVLVDLALQTQIPICGINASQSFKAPLEFLDSKDLGKVILQRGVMT